MRNLPCLQNLKDEMGGYDNELNEKSKFEKRQRLLRGLEQAYGPRGLKLDRVRAIVNSFQTKLPEYTSKLFTERGVKFNIKSGDKELGFEVKRPGKPAFDIRGLSGGEARRMNIALMLMVRFSMPKQKATNLVILDEVDMNVDRIGRVVFSNDLLPIIKNKVSTLIVISHNKDVSDSPSFNKRWVFKKKDNVSSFAG